ncbi:retrotransposon protein, putative, ty1-copia subclass [Tanacetum coccineum]|uniref:Retrotransposon protein, putative, ty1-copia subclass n=1 Tax=Tanacetum coccineum TaxID=301880 RepID=A0ABQ4ZX60_9ASTR
MATEVTNGAETNGANCENVEKTVTFTAVKSQVFVEATKVNDAVLFYKSAFGAEEVNRVSQPKRKADQEMPLIQSVEIKLGSASIIVADASDDDTSVVIVAILGVINEFVMFSVSVYNVVAVVIFNGFMVFSGKNSGVRSGVCLETEDIGSCSGPKSKGWLQLRWRANSRKILIEITEGEGAGLEARVVVGKIKGPYGIVWVITTPTARKSANVEAYIINLRVALKNAINARRLPLAPLVYILMTTSVGNNSVFRSFFEKQKLTGPNFIDWYRQLRLDLAAHAAWVKGQREVVVLMLLTMDLDIQRNLAPFLAAYGMASGTISLCFSKQLKGNYLQTVREFHTCMQEEGHRLAPFLKIEGPTLTIWERLGQPVGQNLAVSLILVSLNKDFTSFVQNFNMHGMGKTVNELHAMLKLHEESLPKKTSPPPMKDNPARTPSVYQMCVKLGMEEGNTVRGSHRVDEKRSYSGRLAFSIFTKTLSFPSNLGYMTMVVENVLCLSGKMARKPYSHQVERAKDLLGLIHTDVCGPFRIVSRQGASYFVTFTDDFSRYGYVYLLKHKHEVFETFKVFQKEVENQLGKTIKSLRSDRGGEYMSQEFLDHLKEHGIIAHRTPPYTPQNNGVIPKGNNGIFFLLPSENKVFVARNAEFFESKLLDLKASGSVEDLEEIQEEDTNPSVDTSLNHEEDDQEIDEPQSDINPIRRSTRTRRPTDRLCLYIDTEEHELGDLGEPANYRAAYGSWNPRNGLMR